MRQTKHSVFRRARRRSYALAGLAALTGLGLFGCEYDDGDWELDQSSGATTSRGGASAAGASRGGTNDSAGTQATGGSGEVPAEYPAPRIDSLAPTSGPYGTAITIKGVGLGNPALPGFTLALGNQGEVELTPGDESAVVSWTDDEIVFRFPFPAQGAVALEGPRGDALAGEFQPTWRIGQELDTAPAATALASISPETDRIMILFDTSPLSLLDVGPAGVLEHSVTASDVETSSLRLYLNAAKEVEGVGVSTGAEPVLVHLKNSDDDLVAAPTAVQLLATEYSVAGGAEGAAVWMRRAAGFQRARPSGVTWALDKGPIADPEPNAPDRASAASSDGSLYLAKSVDTGNFLDDMEAPYMRRLAPTAAMFGGSMSAGGSVDDYITSLELYSSGDGLIVRVCGSDVDPFGLSGSTNYCYDSLHAPSGVRLSGIPVHAKASAHAFTSERAIAAYCTSDQSWLIRTDADVEPAPDAPIGEVVLFPCPEAVALEVNPDGDYLPVVRFQQRTYLLERNPEASGPAGEGGAAGADGAGGAAGAAGVGP